MIYLTLMSFLALQVVALRRMQPQTALTFGILVLATFSFFSVFRGLVGTDSATYGAMMRAIQNGIMPGNEPGFLLHAQVATWVTDNPQMMVNLYSATFFLLILIFFLRGNYFERMYLFAFFAPQYFLNYSMNGIAMGIASAFFLLCHQSLTRGHRTAALAFAIGAFSFHFAILIPFAFYFLFKTPQFSIRANVGRMLSLGLVIGAMLFASDWISNKYLAYSEFEQQDWVAGLSGVVKILIFLPFVFRLRMPRIHLILLCSLSLIIVVGSYVLAQFTYAGLRTMEMFLWLIPLTFIAGHDPRYPVSRLFYQGLMVTGAVGAVFVLRNIFSSAGNGPSPFLPFSFIWEM